MLNSLAIALVSSGCATQSPNLNADFPCGNQPDFFGEPERFEYIELEEAADWLDANLKEGRSSHPGTQLRQSIAARADSDSSFVQFGSATTTTGQGYKLHLGNKHILVESIAESKEDKDVRNGVRTSKTNCR